MKRISVKILKNSVRISFNLILLMGVNHLHAMNSNQFIEIMPANSTNARKVFLEAIQKELITNNQPNFEPIKLKKVESEQQVSRFVDELQTLLGVTVLFCHAECVTIPGERVRYGEMGTTKWCGLWNWLFPTYNLDRYGAGNGKGIGEILNLSENERRAVAKKYIITPSSKRPNYDDDLAPDDKGYRSLEEFKSSIVLFNEAILSIQVPEVHELWAGKIAKSFLCHSHFQNLRDDQGIELIKAFAPVAKEKFFEYMASVKENRAEQQALYDRLLAQKQKIEAAEKK